MNTNTDTEVIALQTSRNLVSCFIVTPIPHPKPRAAAHVPAGAEQSLGSRSLQWRRASSCRSTARRTASWTAARPAPGRPADPTPASCWRRSCARGCGVPPPADRQDSRVQDLLSRAPPARRSTAHVQPPALTPEMLICEQKHQYSPSDECSGQCCSSAIDEHVA